MSFYQWFFVIFIILSVPSICCDRVMSVVEGVGDRQEVSGDLTELSTSGLWAEVRLDPDLSEISHDIIVAGTKFYPGNSEEAIAGYEAFEHGALYAILDWKKHREESSRAS